MSPHLNKDAFEYRGDANVLTGFATRCNMPTLSTSRASRRSWRTLSNCTMRKKTLFSWGSKKPQGRVSGRKDSAMRPGGVHGACGEFATMKDGVYELYPWLSDGPVIAVTTLKRSIAIPD